MNQWFERGLRLFRQGKYEKALRLFTKASNDVPADARLKRWEQRARWVANRLGKDPGVDLFSSVKGTESWIVRKTYNLKAGYLWQLHMEYGLFLLSIGEFDDSELEAVWLDKNDQTDMAESLRQSIKAAKSKQASDG